MFGHYQQQEIHFPQEKRVSDIVHDRHLLEQFLFPPKQQHVFAENLSGGEKRRLHMLTILQTRPNFLILDVINYILNNFFLNAIPFFIKIRYH